MKSVFSIIVFLFGTTGLLTIGLIIEGVFIRGFLFTEIFWPAFIGSFIVVIIIFIFVLAMLGLFYLCNKIGE